jgi:outer membrane protein
MNLNFPLRKILPAILLASLLSASVRAAESRMATVDLQKVFKGYWKTAQAEAALKDRTADMEKEYKGMLDALKKGGEEYESLQKDVENPALSADERDKRQSAADEKLKALRNQQREAEQYKAQATATLQEQTRRMRDNILGEIRTALNAKAKTAGYSMVFDVSGESASGAPMVLYTDTDNVSDLTNTLLGQLNAAAPAGSHKTTGSAPSNSMPPALVAPAAK